MAHDAGTKVKDVGTRYVGYTIRDNQGCVDLRFDTAEDAQAVLDRMHAMTPPLLSSAKVEGIRGVLLERKGGPGRKSNAEKAARAAQASETPSPASTGNEKAEKTPVSAGSTR